MTDATKIQARRDDLLRVLSTSQNPVKSWDIMKKKPVTTRIPTQIKRISNIR